MWGIPTTSGAFRTSRKLIGLVLACAAGLIAVCPAGMARADTPDTLAITVNTPFPEQNIPLSMTFSGADSAVDSIGDGAHLFVDERLTNVPCQPTALVDENIPGTAMVIDNAQQPVGSFTVTKSFTSELTGSHTLCAYLSGASLATVAGPITGSYSVRGPQVAPVGVALSDPPVAGQNFQVTWTTTVDQPVVLDSVIKPATAAALPCATTSELEQGDNIQGEYGLASATTLDGTQTNTATVPGLAAGSYLICTWIEGPTDGEVDQLVSTPVTVPGAPTNRKPITHLNRTIASRRHGITVSGTTLAGFTGHVAAVAACGRSHTQASVLARAGRFKLHLALPQPRCRRARSVGMSVIVAPSTSFAGQTISFRPRITR